MFLVIISLCVFIGLIGTEVLCNKGIPEYISDGFYLIGHWFTALVCTSAFTLLPSILDATPERYQIFGFLCCAGICFVGVAAEYRDKTVYPVHKIAADAAAIAGIIWCSLCSPWGLLGLSVNLLSLLRKDRWFFLAELSCFISVYLGILIKLL